LEASLPATISWTCEVLHWIKPTRWKWLGRHSPSNIKRNATTSTITRDCLFRRTLENATTRNETSIALKASRLKPREVQNDCLDNMLIQIPDYDVLLLSQSHWELSI
jgi:hypothetical protein